MVPRTRVRRPRTAPALRAPSAPSAPRVNALVPAGHPGGSDSQRQGAGGFMPGQARTAAPAATPPQMQQQPASPPAGPSVTAYTGADAEYLAALAQAQFDATQQSNQIAVSEQQDQQDTAEAIRRLLDQSGKDRETIKVGAKNEGLFFSGQLGKRYGEHEAAVTRSRGDTDLEHQRRNAARVAARAALQQGLSVREAGLRAEAVARKIGRDAEAADRGALVPGAAEASSGPAAAPAAPANPSAPQYAPGGASGGSNPFGPGPQTNSQNGKGEFMWPDGKWHSRRYRGN